MRIDRIRAELDRIGVSYRRVGARYVVVVDVGNDTVWLSAPPPPGFQWRGPADELLRRLERMPDDLGLDLFGRVFQGLG